MRTLYLLSLVSLFLFSACRRQEEGAGSASNAVFIYNACVDNGCRAKDAAVSAAAAMLSVDERRMAQINKVTAGHLRQIGMVSRNRPADRKEFGYRAIYDTGLTWTIMFRPADEEGGSVDAWGYVSLPVKHKGDTIIERTVLQDMAALLPGCRRLTQFGSMPFTPHDISFASAAPDEYSMILFRGRYDAELN